MIRLVRLPAVAVAGLARHRERTNGTADEGTPQALPWQAPSSLALP